MRKPAHVPSPAYGNRLWRRRPSSWVNDLVSEKKKREKAPAGKAQILTKFMIVKGLR